MLYTKLLLFLVYLSPSFINFDYNLCLSFDSSIHHNGILLISCCCKIKQRKITKLRKASPFISFILFKCINKPLIVWSEDMQNVTLYKFSWKLYYIILLINYFFKDIESTMNFEGSVDDVSRFRWHFILQFTVSFPLSW